jgi:hypothetical protein
MSTFPSAPAASDRLVMGLKLQERCIHCGEELVIYFRRDMSRRDGPLQCTVVHSIYQSQPWRWKDLHGFEDLTRFDGP